MPIDASGTDGATESGAARQAAPDVTEAEPSERRSSSVAPSTPMAASVPPDRGLFRKRADAIGPAPLFFSVALGIFFGASIGLLLGQPIIGIVFGAMLGALYGVMRGAGLGR